jgi:hypothetical protein
MGRPPKDPSGPALLTLGLRLTAADRDLLDRLVALRAEELVDEAVEVTAGSYLRALIRREARAKGLLEEPSRTGAAARKEPSAEDVHAMLLRAIEAGAVQTAIAREAGIERADLSRFKNGKHTLSPRSLQNLAASLAKHLR